MIKLCAVDDLTDPGSKGFENKKENIFVVRQDNEIYVYETVVRTWVLILSGSKTSSLMMNNG